MSKPNTVKIVKKINANEQPKAMYKMRRHIDSIKDMQQYTHNNNGNANHQRKVFTILQATAIKQQPKKAQHQQQQRQQ
ncbi:unnamed protein product [Ceratitis capitata]|uniref:(Mediterranean fruit fly) hypothetical protein n=1 Tax=Ceratitis capitata TaxID=7213 RepID=A0A811UJC2_CERCA|nr:unnamed protein product [Ceratitis capitata]